MPIEKTLIRFISFCIFCCALPAAAQSRALPLDKIKLPPGFSIEVWADVPNARGLTLGKNGTVFAGSMSEGKVYGITEAGGKREVKIIANGLNTPLGVAFRAGALYVSAIDRILRFDDIEKNLGQPGKPVVVTDTFPSEKHHGGKYLALGPDDFLYVAVGAPCNICETDPERFSLIARIKPDGTGYEVYAYGVRNTVGFDWHPDTRELWFTDNGRDWMGDNLPPDELNHAPRKGMHFGYPYCHGGDIPDPKFGAKRDCGKLTPPAAKFGAHVAALGMRFYTGTMFPPEYRNSIFVAEHGSWNRRNKIGYRLNRVQLKNNKVVKQDVFAEGWLENENAWGRPVDVLVMPDGALLVSDDHAGVIYRISYKKP
ncbi:MAG: sorbosone dehydrogenase family protein [Nitrosospira sp.]|nr:sorbosone dehydrogenase family protein [Nitrosospira sp.]